MFRHAPWLQRSVTAFVLLLSMLAGPLALLPHAEDGDDPACAPVVVAHDESAHGITAPDRSAAHEGQHCFLCHTLRSFHDSFNRFEPHHAAQGAERLHAATLDAAGTLGRTSVSGRAPPR